MEDYLKTKTSFVFSGGGTKGFLLLGALIKIQEETSSSFFSSVVKKYTGTSVGAMIALLLCIGYTPLEIYEELLTKDFNTLTNLLTIFHCFKSPIFSLDSGKNLYSYYEYLVSKKILSLPITLFELFEKTGIELNIISCCISNYPNQTTCILNHKTFPDLDVITAVKMSSSIPFIFPPVVYKNKLYVDGGVSMNYPISIYDSNDESILGFFMDSTHKSSGVFEEVVDTNTNTNTNNTNSKTNARSYIYNIFNVMFNSNIDCLLKLYKNKTVFLENRKKQEKEKQEENYSLSISKEDKENLKQNGFELMENYLLENSNWKKIK